MFPPTGALCNTCPQKHCNATCPYGNDRRCRRTLWRLYTKRCREVDTLRVRAARAEAGQRTQAVQILHLRSLLRTAARQDVAPLCAQLAILRQEVADHHEIRNESLHMVLAERALSTCLRDEVRELREEVDVLREMDAEHTHVLLTERAKRRDDTTAQALTLAGVQETLATARLDAHIATQERAEALAFLQYTQNALDVALQTVRADVGSDMAELLTPSEHIHDVIRHQLQFDLPWPGRAQIPPPGSFTSCSVKPFTSTTSQPSDA
jgi:hypothetical protein